MEYFGFILIQNSNLAVKSHIANVLVQRSCYNLFKSYELNGKNVFWILYLLLLKLFEIGFIATSPNVFTDCLVSYFIWLRLKIVIVVENRIRLRFFVHDDVAISKLYIKLLLYAQTLTTCTKDVIGFQYKIF